MNRPLGAEQRPERVDAADPPRADIQRATPSHAEQYRALMLDAYERHPDAFTSSVAERAALPLSWWEARLAVGPSPADIVFAAFAERRIVGAAGLSFETREKARHKATLFGMYVPLEFRRRGLGNALVRATLDCARARAHVRIVQLTVTEGNDGARSLYEQFGFVPFGVEPFAVAVDTEFVSKVHMWCNIGSTGQNT